MSSEVQLQEKVINLEKTLNDFIRTTNLSYMNVHNAILEQKITMDNFIHEMAEFKNEMAEFKNETSKQINYLNKKWGELSNRLGTLTEDFAAPSLPAIAVKYFGCPKTPQDFMLRRKKLLGDEMNSEKEFDLIVVYQDYVFYNETKSTPRPQYIDEFVDNINIFFDYFPEYKNRKLIPVFASLIINDSIVNKCTKNGIYAMALTGENMDLLNFANIKK